MSQIRKKNMQRKTIRNETSAKHRFSLSMVTLGLVAALGLLTGCNSPMNYSAHVPPRFVPGELSSVDLHTLARFDMDASTRSAGVKVLVDDTVVNDGGCQTVYVRPGKHHIMLQRVHPGVPQYKTFTQDVRDANGNVTRQVTGQILDPSSLNDVVETAKTLDVDVQAGQRYTVTAP
jgi:hypothetical protein